MKVITNTKLINRNAKLGNYLTIGALVCMGGGLLASIYREQYIILYFAALFLGLILFQVGMYYTTRFGRKPRVDEQLTQALKGLPGEYTLYNYNSPVSHLLVGQAGIWAILAYGQRGQIIYDGKRWKQVGGGIGMKYLRFFGQENIGRPDVEEKSFREDLQKFFSKELEGGVPPINTVIVFTDKRAELVAMENAPVPTLPAEKLKDFMRKIAKTTPMPPEEIKRIKELLPQEDEE